MGIVLISPRDIFESIVHVWDPKINLNIYALPASAGSTSMHNPNVNTGNEKVAYNAESIADCSDGRPEKGVWLNIETIIAPIPIA